MEEPTQEVGYRGVCRIDANPILETLLAVRPSGRDDELVSQRRICSPHREESSLVKRLLGEACAAVGLRHQNVVEVREVMLAGMSIVAEYVEGETLRSLLQHRLPLPVVHAIGRGVAAALEHLHSEELEVAHQALSPASIVVNERGEVKLDDVGVMRVLIEHPACVQLARQVLRYAAPETRRGKAARLEEDLYALGALLHEALTGEPFSREQPPHPAVMNPAISPPIDELVANLLHHDPARRPKAHRALIVLNAAPRAQPEQLGRLVKALAEGKPRPSALVGQLAAQRTGQSAGQSSAATTTPPVKPRPSPRATPPSASAGQGAREPRPEARPGHRPKRSTPITAVTSHPARPSPGELAAVAAAALPRGIPARPPARKPASPTPPARSHRAAAKLAMGSSPHAPALPPPLAAVPDATPRVPVPALPDPAEDVLTEVDGNAALVAVVEPGAGSTSPSPPPPPRRPEKRNDVRTTLRLALATLRTTEKFLPRLSRHSAFSLDGSAEVGGERAPARRVTAAGRRRRLAMAMLVVALGVAQWPALSGGVVDAGSEVLRAFTSAQAAPPPGVSLPAASMPPASPDAAPRR